MSYVPRMGSGGPATTADQAETERRVCALTPRAAERTVAEVNIPGKKMREA